jgi:hypothetical protein
MPVNRRWVVALGSAACFAGMSREALAQVILRAAASGKPPLTEKSLNAIIPKPGAATYIEVINAAAADIPGFLRANFTLTESQEAQIDSIPGRAKRQMATLLSQATMFEARVVVDFVGEGANKTIKVGSGGAGVEFAVKG